MGEKKEDQFIKLLVGYIKKRILVNARNSSTGYPAFAHGAVGRRIDPSWGGPIELFLIPASAPRLV